MGERETDVLPMMDSSRVTREQYLEAYRLLQREIERTQFKLDKTLAMVIAGSVRESNNTNWLIDTISKAIASALKNAEISVPEFYAGVYPTNAYNGKTLRFEDQFIVLLHTRFIEAIEVVSTTLIAKTDKPTKIRDVQYAVSTLVNGRIPSDLMISTEGIEWGEEPYAMLMNGADFFIILHEIGHIMLGHIDEASNVFGSRPKSREELEQAWTREFEADAWAFKALAALGAKVRKHVTQEEKQIKQMMSVFLPCIVGDRLDEMADVFDLWKINERQEKDYRDWMAGPTVAFSIGALMEAADTTGRNIIRDHPPPMARLKKLYDGKFPDVSDVGLNGTSLLEVVAEIAGSAMEP
jgi:hypothetical protein